MKIKHLLSLSLPIAAGLFVAVGVHAQDAVPTPADSAQPATDISVSDIEQLINLPISSSIKEYQEDTNKPKSLFDSQTEIDRIFQKTKPQFIYFPEGADPMIIPWVRERIIAQEKFEEATIATANKDYDKAIAILKEIREKFTNTEEGQKAPAEIDKVMAMKADVGGPGPPPPGPQPTVTELPPWIKTNTSAVLLSANSTVLVGNDFLREGDAVPRYPGVKVKAITDSEVVYLYQDKEYVVEVVGSF